MIKTDPDGKPYTKHAPSADLDYSFNWTAWLESGETIQSSTWTATAGLLMTREQIIEGRITSAFAGGGLAGVNYVLTNRIVTSEGRIDSRTITLRCQPR